MGVSDVQRSVRVFSQPKNGWHLRSEHGNLSANSYPTEVKHNGMNMQLLLPSFQTFLLVTLVDISFSCKNADHKTDLDKDKEDLPLFHLSRLPKKNT